MASADALPGAEAPTVAAALPEPSAADTVVPGAVRRNRKRALVALLEQGAGATGPEDTGVMLHTGDDQATLREARVVREDDAAVSFGEQGMNTDNL